MGVNREDVRGLRGRSPRSALTVLVEADLISALTEALTADVEAVLSDDTALVTADTAIAEKELDASTIRSVWRFTKHVQRNKTKRRAD